MAHDYETLTRELATEYRKRAESLNSDGKQHIGEMRNLSNEIQDRFGATELMAINILNGRNVGDYISILTALGKMEKGKTDEQIKE
jgi:hypothetical protein